MARCRLEESTAPSPSPPPPRGSEWLGPLGRYRFRDVPPPPSLPPLVGAAGPGGSGAAGGSEASPLYIHEARAAQHVNEAGRGGRLRRLLGGGGGGGGCWLRAARREWCRPGVTGRR